MGRPKGSKNRTKVFTLSEINESMEEKRRVRDELSKEVEEKEELLSTLLGKKRKIKALEKELSKLESRKRELEGVIAEKDQVPLVE